MESLYFLFSLFAFAWLALWSARGARPSDQVWWPFDMKPPVDDAAAKASRGDGGREAGEPRGWRERVARRDPAALPENTGARSRTTRRGPQHGG